MERGAGEAALRRMLPPWTELLSPLGYALAPWMDELADELGDRPAAQFQKLMPPWAELPGVTMGVTGSLSPRPCDQFQKLTPP